MRMTSIEIHKIWQKEKNPYGTFDYKKINVFRMNRFSGKKSRI